MPLRARIQLVRRLAPPLAAAVLLLGADAALAQENHFLSASCGSGSPVGESTYDPEVSRVEAHWSDGVPGTTASGGRELVASATGTSGILRARGSSANKLNGNRTRAAARIDQRVRPNDDGVGPVGLVVSLGFSSGGDVRARNSASLAVGPCEVFVVEEIGGSAPGITTLENDCNDNASVTWTTSAGPGGLSIQADYASTPSSVYVSASVLGYLGNGTTDIPTGSFSVVGNLDVAQVGGANPPTFYTEDFLTLAAPEPGAGALALAACAALGALARRR